MSALNLEPWPRNTGHPCISISTVNFFDPKSRPSLRNSRNGTPDFWTPEKASVRMKLSFEADQLTLKKHVHKRQTSRTWATKEVHKARKSELGVGLGVFTKFQASGCDISLLVV